MGKEISPEKVETIPAPLMWKSAPTPASPDDAELLRLCEAATPGPWRFQQGARVLSKTNGSTIADCLWDGRYDSHNALFIVALVNAFPRLLAEKQKAEGERDQFVEQLINRPKEIVELQAMLKEAHAEIGRLAARSGPMPEQRTERTLFVERIYRIIEDAEKHRDDAVSLPFSDARQLVACYANAASDLREKTIAEWSFDIDAAPRDGTLLLIWRKTDFPDDTFTVVRWDAWPGEDGWWQVHDGKTDYPLRGDPPHAWKLMDAPALLTKEAQS